MQNTRRRKVVRVSVSGALAGDDANTASRRNSLRRRLDHGFIHAQRSRGKILKIKVGIVAASRERRCQIAFQVAVAQSVVLKKEMIIVHSYWMTSSRVGTPIGDYPTCACVGRTLLSDKQ